MKTGYYEFTLDSGLIYFGTDDHATKYADFIADSADNFLLYAESLECDQSVVYFADSGNSDDVETIAKLRMQSDEFVKI